MRHHDEKGILTVNVCVSVFISFSVCFRHFWRKSLRTLEPGFYLISSFWPSLPSGLDAAYEDTSKDIVFVFKGRYEIIISLTC